MNNQTKTSDAGGYLIGAGILELGFAINSINAGITNLLSLYVAVGLVLLGAGLNIGVAYLQKNNVPVSGPAQ